MWCMVSVSESEGRSRQASSLPIPVLSNTYNPNNTNNTTTTTNNNNDNANNMNNMNNN